ncbi:MAG TPA: glycosyltransferase family 9 protein, partial [Candidatus Limnocylindria bacterium]|nr:glycosyltransferase family 9 protein [Candidatus Limnocylindria bacterium]
MNRQWQAADRILAVRLDSMGDVLMTEPALAALRANGRRHVTLLTSASAAPIARLLPSVDAVLTYPAPWIKATERRDPGLDLMMVERLRAGRFDGAVIFTVYSQSSLPAALTCHLAGIPLRVARSRENPYLLLTDWVREDEPDVERHEVERQLSLVRGLGFVPTRDRMCLRLKPAHRSQALRALLEAGVAMDRPWLVLHPGASAPSRRYPTESYARVADRLVLEDDWQVVLLSGPDDEDLAEEVRSVMRAPTASVGGLSVGEMAAVIAAAPLFVGNNSGPMHVASAVGTPVVVPYAQTNPQHTPWNVPARVLTRDVPCRNCY